jgi:TP901 family phage tail tape measure protein
MSGPMDLTLKVGADSSEAVRAMQRLETEINDTVAAIKKLATAPMSARGGDQGLEAKQRQLKELRAEYERLRRTENEGIKGLANMGQALQRQAKASEEAANATRRQVIQQQTLRQTLVQQIAAIKTNAQVSQQASNERIRAGMRSLAMAEKEVQAQLRLQRIQLQNANAGRLTGRVPTVTFDDSARRNIESTDRAVEKLGNTLNTAAKDANKLDKELDEVDADGIQKAERNVDALAYKLRMTGFALTGAITLPILGLGRAILTVGSNFESSFANVEKVIEGSADQIAQLEADIRSMALEIPMSASGIAEIMAIGGQLGIAADELSAFTEVAIRMGTATNLSAEEAADSIARFLNITNQGMPATASQFEQVGSVVVDLGNKSASTEQEILRMAMRLAAAGTQIGLSQHEILGMSSALASLGIRAESGGSSFSRVMLEIANAVDNGGDALDQFAEVAGVSATQFARVYENEPVQAISMFLEGLNNLREGGENLFPVLEGLDLNTIRVRDATLRAALGYELFADQIKIAAEESRDVNALMIESEKRFQTVGSQWQLVKNNASELAITLFQELRPGILNVMGAMNGMIDTLDGVVEFFGTLPSGVQTAVVAFLALAAALPPILIFIGLILPGLAAVQTALFGTAVAAEGVAASAGLLAGMGGPISLVVLALVAAAAAVYLLYQNSEQFQRIADGVWDAFVAGAKLGAEATVAAAKVVAELAAGLADLVKSPWVIQIEVNRGITDVVKELAGQEDETADDAYKRIVSSPTGPQGRDELGAFEEAYYGTLKRLEEANEEFRDGERRRAEAVQIASAAAIGAIKQERVERYAAFLEKQKQEQDALAAKNPEELYTEIYEQELQKRIDAFNKAGDIFGVGPSKEQMAEFRYESSLAADQVVADQQRMIEAREQGAQWVAQYADASATAWEQEALAVQMAADQMAADARRLQNVLGSANTPEQYFQSYFSGFDGIQMRLTTLAQVFPQLADGGVQAIQMLATAVDDGLMSSDQAIQLFAQNGRLSFEEFRTAIEEQMSGINDAIVTALAGDPETGEIDWMQIKGLQEQYAELDSFLTAAEERQRQFASTTQSVSDQIIGMYGALGQMGTDATAAMGLWEQKQNDANTALEKNQELFDAGKITQEEYLANQELLTWASERYGGAVLDESLAFIEAQNRMAIYTAGLDELNKKFPEGERDSKEYRAALAELTTLVDPAAASTLTLVGAMETLADGMNAPIERITRLMLTLGLITEKQYNFVVNGEMEDEPVTTGIAQIDKMVAVARVLKVVAEFEMATNTLASDPIFGKMFDVIGNAVNEAAPQIVKVAAELDTSNFDTGITHVDTETTKKRDLIANAALDRAGFDPSLAIIDSEVAKQRLLTVATFVDLGPFWAAIATINANLPMNSPALEGPLSVYPDWGFVTERMAEQTQPGVDEATEAISSMLPMNSPAARGTLSNYPNWGFVTETMGRDTRLGVINGTNAIAREIDALPNRLVVNWSWLFSGIDMAAEDAGEQVGQAVVGWVTDLQGIASGEVGQRLKDELAGLFDLKQILIETGAPAEAIAEIDQQISDKSAEIAAIGKIIGTTVIQGIATEMASEEAGEKLLAALETAFGRVDLDSLLDESGEFDPSKLFGDVEDEIARLETLRDAAFELGLSDLAAKYQTDLEALYVQYGVLVQFLNTDAVQAWIAEKEAIAASTAELEAHQAWIDRILQTQQDLAVALGGGAEDTQAYFDGLVDKYETAKEAVRMGELLGFPPEVMDQLYADLQEAGIILNEASMLLGEALRNGALDEETLRALAETGGEWFRTLYDQIFGPGALAELEKGWTIITDASFEQLQQMIADGLISGQQLVDAVVEGMLSGRLSLQQAMQLLGDDLGEISEETAVMLLDTYKRLAADLATALATGEGIEAAQAAYDQFMQFLQSIAEATGISIEILIEQWEALASKIEETAARTGKSIKVFGDAAREASAVVGGDEEGTTPTYRAPGGSGGGTGGGGGGSAFGSLYGPNSPGAYGAAYRAGVRTWSQFENWVNGQVELGNVILNEAQPQSVKLSPKGYEAHTNAVNVGGKMYNPSTPEQALAYLKMRDQEAARAAGRPTLSDLGRNPMGSAMTKDELAAFRQEFEDTNAAMRGLNTSVGSLSDEMQKTADEMADGTRKATDALGRFAGLLEPSEFDSLRRIPIFDAFFGGADFSHFFNKDIGHGTGTGSSTMNNETRVYIDSEEVSARVEKRLLPTKGTVRT